MKASRRFMWAMVVWMASSWPLPLVAHAADINVAFREANTAAQNTTAWNNAVAVIPSGGARICLPDGTFNVNALTMTNKNNMSVVGGGCDGSYVGRTVLVGADTDNDVMNISGSDRLELRGFDLWHASASNSAKAAVRVRNYNGIIVDRINTSGGHSHNGLILTADGGNGHAFMATVQHSHFNNHAGHGIWLFGATMDDRPIETTLTHNLIGANETTGLYVGDFVTGV